MKMTPKQQNVILMNTLGFYGFLSHEDIKKLSWIARSCDRLTATDGQQIIDAAFTVAIKDKREGIYEHHKQEAAQTLRDFIKKYVPSELFPEEQK